MGGKEVLWKSKNCYKNVSTSADASLSLDCRSFELLLHAQFSPSLLSFVLLDCVPLLQWHSLNGMDDDELGLVCVCLTSSMLLSFYLQPSPRTRPFTQLLLRHSIMYIFGKLFKLYTIRPNKNEISIFTERLWCANIVGWFVRRFENCGFECENGCVLHNTNTYPAITHVHQYIVDVFTIYCYFQKRNAKENSENLNQSLMLTDLCIV